MHAGIDSPLVEIGCSCIRCGYAPGGATCPECGASAADSRAQWAQLGGEVATLRRVRRVATPLVVLVSFQALGWAFDWRPIVTFPSIPIGSLGYVFRFDIVLDAPFLVASVVTSGLWLWMACRHGAWSGRRASRAERAIAAVWCAAACAALVPFDLRMRVVAWVLQSLDVDAWSGVADMLMDATNHVLLPIAAGAAALRLIPPRSLAAWRHRLRWLRRGALATIVTSAVLAIVLIVNDVIKQQVGYGYGSGAQPIAASTMRTIQFLHDAAFIINWVAVSVAVIGLAVALLHLLACAATLESSAFAGSAPAQARSWRRGAVAAAVGGVLVIMIMVSTIIEMIREHWMWWDHDFDSYTQVGGALVRNGWPTAQLLVMSCMTGVGLLWIVAALAPGFVVRRAIAKSMRRAARQ